MDDDWSFSSSPSSTRGFFRSTSSSALHSKSLDSNLSLANDLLSIEADGDSFGVRNSCHSSVGDRKDRSLSFSTSRTTTSTTSASTTPRRGRSSTSNGTIGSAQSSRGDVRHAKFADVDVLGAWDENGSGYYSGGGSGYYTGGSGYYTPAAGSGYFSASGSGYYSGSDGSGIFAELALEFKMNEKVNNRTKGMNQANGRHSYHSNQSSWEEFGNGSWSGKGKSKVNGKGKSKGKGKDNERSRRKRTKSKRKGQGRIVKLGKERGDDVDIYYELHGRGPHKVIFIMGFGTSSKGWSETARYFTRHHEEEFQVCIFDNRGVGHSSTPASRFSTQTMALDVQDLLDHLGWGTVHVVGMSMGGMIAQELSLLLGSERLLSLVLAVTHAGGRHALVPLSGMWNLASNLWKGLEQRVTDIMKASYSKSFLDKSCHHDESKTYLELEVELYLKRLREEPQPTGKGVLGQMTAATTHYMSSARLKQIRDIGAPIVVMTGTTDVLVKPHNSHILAKELQATEFVVFEGAGHCINTECFDQFHEVIIRNLRRGIERVRSDGSGTHATSPTKITASSTSAAAATAAASECVKLVIKHYSNRGYLLGRDNTPNEKEEDVEGQDDSSSLGASLLASFDASAAMDRAAFSFVE